jgi:hypothetical protein
MPYEVEPITIDELAETVRPIAGYPLTIIFIMSKLGGRASAAELKYILGISLPTLRKHCQAAIIARYIKKTASYQAPEYFLTDRAKQIVFPDFELLQDSDQSEKILQISYSSSIKDSLSFKDFKELNTNTNQSEKIFHIPEGFEVSWEAKQIMTEIGIWKPVQPQIAAKFNNDIKEIARWFPPEMEVGLSMWRLKQGIEPEALKEVCPDCGSARAIIDGVCYIAECRERKK